MTALQLWIVEFKFTQNFVICYRLLDTVIIFGIYISKRSFHLHMLGTKGKIAIYKGMVTNLHAKL